MERKIHIMGEPRLLSEVSFRKIYGHFLYVECRDVLEDIMPEMLTAEDTGLCVYGYIDEEAGLSFHPFKIASYGKEEILRARDIPDVETNSFILRYHGKYVKQFFTNDFGKVTLATITPQDHTFIDLEDLGVEIEQYEEIEDMIKTTYKAESPEKEKLRGKEYDYLDPFRYPECPDDVMVILFSTELKPERVWVRCKFEVEAENEIFGTLLTEPKNGYSLHKGQMIGFGKYTEEGQTMLVATGHTAKTITESE